MGEVILYNRTREKKFEVVMAGKELKRFCTVTVFLLLAAAFMMGSPRQIAEGMKTIILCRDALITDYFEMANYGAAFFNVALLAAIVLMLLCKGKVPFTGITMAVFFINIGYGFWGKNPVNIAPVLLGTWLYAKFSRAPMSRYIYTALFGTCLSPLVTEMMHILPFDTRINLLCAVFIGILVGFILPPLSVHTASMHAGYNLFNVGFSGGIIAFVLVCILKAVGIESATVFIWKEGRHPGILVGIYLYFGLTILYGLWIATGKYRRKMENTEGLIVQEKTACSLWQAVRAAGRDLLRITRHRGRAVTDFILMDGAGVTLMNMGLMGITGATYIVLTGGDLSGPVLGTVFTAFGFSAFGAHLKNYLPVLLGVYLLTFVTQYTPATPGLQLAALFAVGLSPIAGQFGILVGMAAGALHSCIVMCTASMYGGLNLYNNGFSAGWVAITIVPIAESFISHFELRRNAVKGKKQQEKDKSRKQKK